MEREKINKGRMGKNRKGGDRDKEGENERERKIWRVERKTAQREIYRAVEKDR